MKQFVIGNGEEFVKILYDEYIIGQRIYYKGKAYAIIDFSSELNENNEVFFFDFYRDFFSWDKISEVKIEIANRFENALRYEVDYFKERMVNGIRFNEGIVAKRN